MFSYEKEINGKMNIDRLWDLYANVNRWPEWDTTMQKVVLDCDFAAGTRGTMFMNGMPPLPYTLDVVEKGNKFINSSMLGDISVQFGHFIIDEGNNEYKVKHTVTITGPNEAQIQGMGHGIVANIPDCMENLLQLSKMD